MRDVPLLDEGALGEVHILGVLVLELEGELCVRLCPLRFQQRELSPCRPWLFRARLFRVLLLDLALFRGHSREIVPDTLRLFETDLKFFLPFRVSLAGEDLFEPVDGFSSEQILDFFLRLFFGVFFFISRFGRLLRFVLASASLFFILLLLFFVRRVNEEQGIQDQMFLYLEIER